MDVTRKQRTKHAKFSEKKDYLLPLIRTPTCAYQGVRNVSFWGKSGVLCFVVTSVLRFDFFCLINNGMQFLIPLQPFSTKEHHSLQWSWYSLTLIWVGFLGVGCEVGGGKMNALSRTRENSNYTHIITHM